MNDRDANRLQMFRTVNATCQQPEHAAVWQNQPPAIFARRVTQFGALLADLESLVERREAQTTGHAEQKQREEQELEAIAYQTGAVLSEYYLDRQQEALAAQVDFPPSSWQLLRDEQLIARSQTVLNRLQEALASDGSPPSGGGIGTITVTDAPTNDPPIVHAAPLADYGLTAASAAALEKELQDYVAIVSAPQTTTTGRAAMTKMLRERFLDIARHLERMDKLVDTFRTTPAGVAFAESWTAARNIYDRGHGPTTPPQDPPESPEPTAA